MKPPSRPRKPRSKSAQATVEQAELNLGFTKVRSLISGIAGTAATQIGNLVSQTTVLTTVSQVDPIKAYFPISEQEYLQVSQRINPGASGDWLAHSAMVPLQLTLSNNEVYPKQGPHRVCRPASRFANRNHSCRGRLR